MQRRVRSQLMLVCVCVCMCLLQLAGGARLRLRGESSSANQLDLASSEADAQSERSFLVLTDEDDLSSPLPPPPRPPPPSSSSHMTTSGGARLRTNESADVREAEPLLQRVFQNDNVTTAVHVPNAITSFKPDVSQNRLDQLMAVHLDRSNFFASAAGSPSRVGITKVFEDLRESLRENMRYLQDSFRYFDAKCNSSIAKSRERMAAYSQLRALASASKNGTARARLAKSKDYDEKIRNEKLIHNQYVLVCHSRLVQHLQDVEQTRADLEAVSRALSLLASGSEKDIQAFIAHEKQRAMDEVNAPNTSTSGGAGTARGSSGLQQDTKQSPSDMHRALALQLAATREKAAHLSSYESALGGDSDPRLVEKENAVKKASNNTAQLQMKVAADEAAAAASQRQDRACQAHLKDAEATLSLVEAQVINLTVADRRLQQKLQDIDTRQRELELQYITIVRSTLLESIAQNLSAVNLSLGNASAFADITTAVTTDEVVTTETTTPFWGAAEANVSADGNGSGGFNAYASGGPPVAWKNRAWTFDEVLRHLSGMLDDVQGKLAEAAARSATTTTEGPSDLDLFGPESDDDEEELLRRARLANLQQQQSALRDALLMLNRTFTRETDGAAVLRVASGDLMQQQNRLRDEAARVSSVLAQVRNQTLALAHHADDAQGEVRTAEATCNRTSSSLARKRGTLERSREFLAAARAAQAAAEKARRAYLDFTIQATFNRRRSLSPFFLPEEPPLVVLPCGLYKSCGECTAAPSCGWLVPNTHDHEARRAVLRNPTERRRGICVAGSASGPTLAADYAAPFASYNFDTCSNVSKGIFGNPSLVETAPCATYQGCEQCAKAAGCGFCGSTLQCLPAPHATGQWPVVRSEVDGQVAVLVGREDLGPKHHLLCPNSLSPTWIPGRDVKFARLLEDNTTEELPVASCAPRQVSLPAAAVAMLFAQRRYDALLAQKEEKVRILGESASSNVNGSMIPSVFAGEAEGASIGWSQKADELALLSRRLDEAADDLRQAQMGNIRTFGDGYAAGLRAAEYRDAKEIGRLEAQLETARQNGTSVSSDTDAYMVLAKLVTDEVGAHESRGVLAQAANAERRRQVEAIAEAVQQAVQTVIATLPAIDVDSNEDEPEPEAETDETTLPPQVDAAGNVMIVTRPPFARKRRRLTTTTAPSTGGPVTNANVTPQELEIADAVPRSKATRDKVAARAAGEIIGAAVQRLSSPNLSSSVLPKAVAELAPLLSSSQAMGARLAATPAARNGAAKAAFEAKEAEDLRLAALAALPKVALGSIIELKSLKAPSTSLRHCANQMYTTEKYGSDSSEFRFTVVAALNGRDGAVSLQSVSNPFRYISVSATDVDQNKAVAGKTRVGLAVPPRDNPESLAAASFQQVDAKLVPLAARWSPILAAGGGDSASADACGCDAGVAFQSMALGMPPAYLAVGETLSGTCHASSPLPVFKDKRAFDVVVDTTTKAMLLARQQASKGTMNSKPMCPVCAAHRKEVAAAAFAAKREQDAAAKATKNQALSFARAQASAELKEAQKQAAEEAEAEAARLKAIADAKALAAHVTCASAAAPSSSGRATATAFCVAGYVLKSFSLASWGDTDGSCGRTNRATTLRQSSSKCHRDLVDYANSKCADRTSCTIACEAGACGYSTSSTVRFLLEKFSDPCPPPTAFAPPRFDRYGRPVIQIQAQPKQVAKSLGLVWTCYNKSATPKPSSRSLLSARSSSSRKIVPSSISLYKPPSGIKRVVQTPKKISPMVAVSTKKKRVVPPPPVKRPPPPVKIQPPVNRLPMFMPPRHSKTKSHRFFRFQELHENAGDGEHIDVDDRLTDVQLNSAHTVAGLGFDNPLVGTEHAVFENPLVAHNGFDNPLVARSPMSLALMLKRLVGTGASPTTLAKSRNSTSVAELDQLLKALATSVPSQQVLVSPPGRAASPVLETRDLNQTAVLQGWSARAALEAQGTSSSVDAASLLRHLALQLAEATSKRRMLDTIEDEAHAGLVDASERAAEQQTAQKSLRDELEKQHVKVQAMSMAMWAASEATEASQESGPSTVKFGRSPVPGGASASAEAVSDFVGRVESGPATSGNITGEGSILIAARPPPTDSAIVEQRAVAKAGFDAAQRAAYDLERAYNAAKSTFETTRRTTASYQAVERDVRMEQERLSRTMRTLDRANAALRSALSDSFTFTAVSPGDDATVEQAANSVSTHGVAIDLGQAGYNALLRASAPSFSVELFMRLNLNTAHSPSDSARGTSNNDTSSSTFVCSAEARERRINSAGAFFDRVRGGCAIVLASAFGETAASDSATVLDTAARLATTGAAREASLLQITSKQLLRVRGRVAEKLASETKSGQFCADHGWYIGFDALRSAVVFGMADERSAFHELSSHAITAATGGWHHIAVTHDGEQARLFVDGSLADWYGGRPGALLRNGTGSVMILGARTGSVGTPCKQLPSSTSKPVTSMVGDVEIDDIALWGRALTFDDLSQHLQQRTAFGISLLAPKPVSSELRPVEINAAPGGLVAFYNFGPARSSPAGSAQKILAFKAASVGDAAGGSNTTAVAVLHDQIRDAVGVGGHFLDGLVWQPSKSPKLAVSTMSRRASFLYRRQSLAPSLE